MLTNYQSLSDSVPYVIHPPLIAKIQSSQHSFQAKGIRIKQTPSVPKQAKQPGPLPPTPRVERAAPEPLTRTAQKIRLSSLKKRTKIAVGRPNPNALPLTRGPAGLGPCLARAWVDLPVDVARLPIPVGNQGGVVAREREAAGKKNLRASEVSPSSQLFDNVRYHYTILEFCARISALVICSSE